MSVIIPVYNAERYLDETLESVMCQTLRNIEIICIDDASTDASRSILMDYTQRDDRITLVSCVDNGGCGRSCNLGIELASGKYIQILGNDDLLEHDALEKLFNVCQQEGIDFCQYSVHVFSDEVNDQGHIDRKKRMEHYHRVEHEYGVTTGVVLMKAQYHFNEYRMTNGPQFVRLDLIKANGIRNIEGVKHEDMYYTYCILMAAQRATLMPDPFYKYRIRRGSQEFNKEETAQNSAECFSLLRSSVAMARDTPSLLFGDEEFNEVIRKYVFSHLKRALAMYEKLTPEDQVEVESMCTPLEKSYLYLVKGWRQGRLRRFARKMKKHLKHVRG